MNYAKIAEYIKFIEEHSLLGALCLNLLSVLMIAFIIHRQWRFGRCLKKMIELQDEIWDECIASDNRIIKDLNVTKHALNDLDTLVKAQPDGLQRALENLKKEAETRDLRPFSAQ